MVIILVKFLVFTLAIYGQSIVAKNKILLVKEKLEKVPPSWNSKSNHFKRLNILVQRRYHN